MAVFVCDNRFDNITIEYQNKQDINKIENLHLHNMTY